MENKIEILITGASGLLGYSLVRSLTRCGRVTPLRRVDLDIADRKSVLHVLGTTPCDVVVHSAAIADPDSCQLNPEAAYTTNVTGTENIVDACVRQSKTLIFVSSDAVFGNGTHSEEELTAPINIYGVTKAKAEVLVKAVPKHFIFRLSVLFGPGKSNFIERSIHLLRQGSTVRAAVDQVASATYTVDAAEKIADVLARGPGGIYHLCNMGGCSRFDLVRTAALLARLPTDRVIPTSIIEMDRPAPRASNVGLQMTSLSTHGFSGMRDWQSALAEYVDDLCHRPAQGNEV